MDDIEVMTQTLNSTIQRTVRQSQNYEIEIANLTAEIYRLQSKVEELERSAGTKADAKPSPAKQ